MLSKEAFDLCGDVEISVASTKAYVSEVTLLIMLAYKLSNLDKEFIGLSLLDLIYMEYIIYAIQLRYYGVDTTNIRHAINDLFHLNYAIKQ